MSKLKRFSILEFAAELDERTRAKTERNRGRSNREKSKMLRTLARVRHRSSVMMWSRRDDWSARSVGLSESTGQAQHIVGTHVHLHVTQTLYILV